MNKHIDNCEIDWRPASRRANGGLRGMADRLACCGSMGSPETQTSTAQNKQVTLQGGGAGSTVIGTGADSSANVTIQSVDPAIAHDAFVAATNVSDTALSSNTIVAQAALNTNSVVTQAADNLANNASTNAFIFGREVLDHAAESLSVIETQNSQLQGQSNDTIQHIAGQLAQITANAAPQTTAAQQEISAGSSPIGGHSGISDNMVNLAIIAGTVLSAIALIRSRGKST